MVEEHKGSFHTLDVASLIIFLGLAFSVGHKPLLDVDVGWHLAGGLWILDNFQFPILDPFGAEANRWVAYSYLPEIVFALVFKKFSFSGLQYLQTCTILLSVLVVWHFLRSTQLKFKNTLRERLYEAVTMGVILLLISPVWHLRPQVYSIIILFFWIIYVRGPLTSFRYFIPATILWANIHVYWILGPLLSLTYNRSRHGVGLFLVGLTCACLNPYGVEVYFVLWDYIFHHEVANSFIAEFRHLSPQFSYLFWIPVICCLAMAIYLRRVSERLTWTFVVLFFVFAALSFFRIKYIPLFAPFVGVFLSQVLLPALFGLENFAQEPLFTKSLRRFSVLLIGLFIACCLLISDFRKPLPKPYSELLAISEFLKSSRLLVERSPIIVLNHFDQGGWLALGFYLARDKNRNSARFKTSIDGRTLVMGPTRLKEFRHLLRNSVEARCQTLASWKPELAILPRLKEEQRGLISVLEQGSCGSRWKQRLRTENFILLKKIEGASVVK